MRRSLISARSRRIVLAAALALSTILGAAVAQAEPALWKISGAKGAVYLFGTVHVLKPETVWRSAKVDHALAETDALWLEVPDADDAAAMQALIMKYGLDPAHPLSSKLDDASKTELAAITADLGLPPSALEPMRPWLAGLSLSILPLTKAGYDPKSGVEQVLKAEEAKAGKPILGFETTEQQIRYLADVSPAMEMEFLKSSLDDAGKAAPDIDALVAAWAAGDEVAIETLMNDDMRKDYPELYQRLLVARNVRFAEKIAVLAKSPGVIFVAVGAAHLVGPDSVQADLKKLGVIAVRQ